MAARLAGSLIIAAMILWPSTPDSYCLMGEIHRNNPAWWQEAVEAGKRMQYHGPGYTYFYDHRDGGWYFKRGGQNISINWSTGG